MDTLQYKLIQLLFALPSFTLIFFIYKGIRAGLQNSGYSTESQKKISLYFLSAVTLWIIFVSVLSLKGFFLDFSTTPPKIFIVLIIPLITTIYFLISKRTNKILTAVPEEWLIYIQSFRIIVEILLWMLLLNNLLPVQMSFEGRNFDIIAGLTAPVIAYFCYTKKKWSSTVALVWNFIGLALLLNIVIIAILSMPTKLRVFMNEPSNTIVANFPIIFLPAILVPVAYAIHLFSIKQILLKRKGVVS
ncbi:MAG: hypothetical protein JST55_00460 [Bacteroidetes bacterium]|nr:hypothetical protein [Bacteroidota bacterium]